MKISIVMPCYQEEEVLHRTYGRVAAVADGIQTAVGSVEMIFVNDGSIDRSGSILADLAQKDDRITVVTLSRNFGHQAAVSAGMSESRGDAVVIIDADLQDPPEVIPNMIAAWREGAEVVYGRRRNRAGEGFFKRMTAKIYYRFLDRLTDIDIPLDTGDFRLVDRKVVDAFNALPERNKYVRGLFAWMGFRQVAVDYDRDARAAGYTKYPLKKMLQLAADGLVSFSRKPLIAALRIGLATIVVALGLMIYVFISYFSAKITVVPGWASLMLVVLALGGIQLFSIGVLGAYIGRLYDEAKMRPEYIISEKIDPPRFMRRRVEIREEAGRIVRFLIVGLFNSMAFASVSWAGNRVGFHYVVYTSLGYAALLSVSFLLNSRFTFRSAWSIWRSTLPRFLAVTVTLLIVAEGIQFLLIEEADLPEIVGILGGMTIYMTVSYFFIRNWVFAKANP